MRKGLKIRLPYIILTIMLLTVEVLIGAFVHDDFVRPFVGDMLVAVLLCTMGRVVFLKWRWLPLAVLLLATVVELSQLLELDRLLGIKGTVLGTALGSTFDVADLICYTVGCGMFFVCEIGIRRFKPNK